MYLLFFTMLLAAAAAGAAGASEYRSDAAAQIYNAHPDRVYRGTMPPLLHAVGVVQVIVDGSGNVTEVRWLRKPRDDVAVQIESLIRSTVSLSSLPEGGTAFVETWLWDKSGKFQLKSLTEGQK